MKEFKKYANPELQKVIQHRPAGIISGWRFQRLVVQVLEEGLKGANDEKLRQLQEQFGPKPHGRNAHWEWIFLTCDMVSVHRRANSMI